MTNSTLCSVFKPILQINDLSVGFGGSENIIDNLSLDLVKGQMLGIVGESGSGKSVLVNSLMRLLPENARVKGDLSYMGENLLSFSDKQMTAIRGRVIALMLQNSMSALNPVVRISNQIKETMQAHGLPWDVDKARALLSEMGFKDPDNILNSFPHELSGGMRQRIGIAIAIAAEPEILIADEPTTALDVVNEQKIMSILTDLNKRKGTTIILVSHNLKMVANVCSRMAVMYAGCVLETGNSSDIISDPMHPYTKELMRCDQILNNRSGELYLDDREPGNKADGPGCRYSTRCDLAFDRCDKERPPLVEIGGKERKVACFVAR